MFALRHLHSSQTKFGLRMVKINSRSLSTTHDFDICVIGGGPGGYAAAMRAYDLGKSVCIVEKGPLGGAGLWDGALASKTFWHLSRDYKNNTNTTKQAYRLDRYKDRPPRPDMERARNVMEFVVNKKVSQLQHQLDFCKIPVIAGRGSFEDAHTIKVEGADGNISYVRASDIIIATGSSPREHPTIKCDGNTILNSDQIMRLDEFPESMVILGAGVIGCEFASIFSNFKQTKVSIIDKASRILPFEDEDVAQVISSRMVKKDVHVHQGCDLKRLEVIDGKVQYIIKHPQFGEEEYRVEKCLISIGRTPNVNNLNLEAAGVQLTPQGLIKEVVPGSGRTTATHVWAIGDVTIGSQLVNIAELEARNAVQNIVAGANNRISYDNIAMIMFLDPMTSGVGYNELQLQQQRVPYRYAVYSFELTDRAMAMRATAGFVKVLISNDGRERLLGIRALGAHAGSLVDTASLLIRMNSSIAPLLDLRVAYPASSQALQETVRMFSNSSVMKPSAFPKYARCGTVTYDEDGKPVDERLLQN